MYFEILHRCTWIFILITVLGFAPLCCAETSSDKPSIAEVKKETHDFIQVLKSYTADRRDEAIQKTKETLDDLDYRINALEKNIDQNWHKMDKSARENARTSLDVLRKRRTQVTEWYNRLKSSSVDAWGHMKKGFLDAYGSLYDAWEKSEKEFGSVK